MYDDVLVSPVFSVLVTLFTPLPYHSLGNVNKIPLYAADSKKGFPIGWMENRFKCMQNCVVDDRSSDLMRPLPSLGLTETQLARARRTRNTCVRERALRVAYIPAAVACIALAECSYSH